jgi:ABC-type hemin transport system ATPase subunit
MATLADFENVIGDLAEVWGNPAARNGLFGNILKSIAVKSIRGMSVDIEFSWPVTAIAGTNGSGKTTILQLCSAAYVRPQGGRNYKIGEWIRNALKDETAAFGESSSVSFSFWNDSPVVPIPWRCPKLSCRFERRLS